jgi:hypothetical protein
MGDWTPNARDIHTPNGVIHYGGACRDDYPNMVVYDQGGGNTVIELQAPAMRAFKDAEAWVWDRLHPILRRRGKKGRDLIPVLPGTNRTCTTQTRLHNEDSSRYADPKITGHTRGIAIDRDRRVSLRRRLLHHRALLKFGWTQTRPIDEPWHYSYGVTV